MREVRGRLEAVVEVDEEVLGRVLFRCSSLSLSGADGLRGDGDEGRESDIARGRATVLIGDVVRPPGSSFDRSAPSLMSSCGRGAISKKSIRTVPIAKISLKIHTRTFGAYRVKPGSVCLHERLKSLLHRAAGFRLWYR